MKMRKRMLRTTRAGLSTALSLLLAATVLPAAAFGDEESQEEDGGLYAGYQKIIEPGTPEGYSDDMENPYGKPVGESFLLTEQNELLLYYSFNTNSNTRNRYASWYDNFTVGNHTNLTSKSTGFETSGSYDGTKAYNYVQAIGFDPNGSGRKDHIAYLGYERTGNNKDKGYFVLWVVNAKNGEQSQVMRVRSHDNASCGWLDEHNADLYAGSNFFNIVAGDFDGHGGDDLVISIVDDSGYGLSQIRYENGGFTEIARGERGLLHPVYNERFNANSGNWTNEAKDKLACDLTVGDFNGDGIDDLAVLSYPNYGHSENGTNNMTNVAFGTPYLAVSYGDANGVNFVRTAAAGTYVSTPIENEPEQTRATMLCSSIAAGDIDNDGRDEILSAGYLGNSTIEKGSGFFHTIFASTMSDNLLYGSFRASEDKLVAIEYKELEPNEWTKVGSGAEDLVGPKLAIEAASIDGKVNPDRIFISGTMYRCEPEGCKLFTELNAGEYSPVTLNYFKKADDDVKYKSVGKSYLAAVAVGNFTNREQDSEQIAYVVGLQSDDSAHDYSFSVHIASGVNFTDNVASGYQLDTGDYIFYNQKFGLNKRTNCTIAAIDRDEDGVLASYVGAGYAWSDPQVQMILQASPYFSELSDNQYLAGSNTTQYTTKTTYSYGHTSTHNRSIGTGFAGDVTYELINASVRLGYAQSWTWTFSKTVETEVENSFSASDRDTVVLCRTPTFVYSYNITCQDNEGNTVNDVYQMAFPKAPVFEQMALDDYNEFASYYNGLIKSAAEKKGVKESEYSDSLLQTIDGDLYLGSEGNPYGYYQRDRSGKPGPIPQEYGDLEGLATNGSSNSISYSFSQSEGSSREIAKGVSFDFAIQGGFSCSGAALKTGGYVSLQDMRGWSTSTSNGIGTSYSCSVMGLQGKAMKNAGLDPEDWNFKWKLAVWDSNLKSTTPKNDPNSKSSYVPVLGYSLSSITSPSPSIENLRASVSKGEDAGSLIKLSWECGDIAGSGYPATAGYRVYAFDGKQNQYVLIDTIEGAQATEYTYQAPANESKYYSFMVTSYRSATTTSESLESIPRQVTCYVSKADNGDDVPEIGGNPGDTQQPSATEPPSSTTTTGTIVKTLADERNSGSATSTAEAVMPAREIDSADANGNSRNDVTATTGAQADDASANAKTATTTSENDRAQADAQSQDGSINVGYIVGFLALALALLGLALVTLRAAQNKRS